MDAPTGARRCEVHGLAVGPDGACVLCRRVKGRAPVAGDATPASAIGRLVTWLLALGTAGSVVWIAEVALQSARDPTPVVVATPVVVMTRPAAPLSPPMDARVPIAAPTQPPQRQPDPTTDPVSTTATAEPELSPTAAEPPPAPDPSMLEQQREIEEQDRRRHEQIEADMRAQTVASVRRRVPVVMYSTAQCASCVRARDYLQRERLAFTEYDVERDPAAGVRAGNLNPRRSLPTIEVDGRDVLIAFDGSAFEAALARAVDRRIAKGIGATSVLRDLHAIVEATRQRYGLPAMGAAIVENHRVTALGVSGLRVAGREDLGAFTADDPWHLGSCTKAMTATVLARLVERKILSWDTTIGEAFADEHFRIHPEYRDVSLKMLLTHRGGTPAAWSPLPSWGALQNWPGSSMDARHWLVSQVVGTPPETTPGRKYLYSNLGYVVAATMAEVRTHTPWEDLATTELFGPLGMTSAAFGAPGASGASRYLAAQPLGHWEGGQIPVAPEQGDFPSAFSPAGRVHATLADWARFAALHLAGARGEQGLLLKAETFRALHTPAAGQEYALGWDTRAHPGWLKGPLLMHGGTNKRWMAEIWIAPALDLAVLVATNQGGHQAQEAVETLGRRLLSGS